MVERPRRAIFLNAAKIERGYFERPHGTLRPGLSINVTADPPTEGIDGSLTLIVVKRVERDAHGFAANRGDGSSVDLDVRDSGAPSEGNARGVTRYALIAGHVAAGFGAFTPGGKLAYLQRPMKKAGGSHVTLGAIDHGGVEWPDPIAASQFCLDYALVPILPEIDTENAIRAKDHKDEQVLIPIRDEIVSSQELQDVYPGQGYKILKFGRSGYAEGFVETVPATVDARVRINGRMMLCSYDQAVMAYSDQSAMARPGDSGALVTDEHYRPLGMVVAGPEKKKSGKSEFARPYALIQLLAPVFGRYNLALWTKVDGTKSTPMVPHTITVQQAEAAKHAARREAVKRGGHVFGVGVGTAAGRCYVVVYVSNRVLPRDLRVEFTVRNVPVKAVQVNMAQVGMGVAQSA